MQTAITLLHEGQILRGMEHVPAAAADEKLPAVIIFHGFTGTMLEPHRLFLKISRALEEKGIAVFRFDFLGSGESDGDFEDMTVSGEIADAGAILDMVRRDRRIDANRVSLIGLSMGGLVAGVLAGDRPADVDRLILLAPAGNMAEVVKEGARSFMADSEQSYYDYGGNRVGRGFVTDLMTIDIFGRSSRYTGEVLLIHGTNDTTVPAGVSSLYQARAYHDRAQIRLIEGADHTFNRYEWELEVISAVCAFLDRH